MMVHGGTCDREFRRGDWAAGGVVCRSRRSSTWWQLEQSDDEGVAAQERPRGSRQVLGHVPGGGWARKSSVWSLKSGLRTDASRSLQQGTKVQGLVGGSCSSPLAAALVVGRGSVQGRPIMATAQAAHRRMLGALSVGSVYCSCGMR
jgi:hypothetical protein